MRGAAAGRAGGGGAPADGAAPRHHTRQLPALPQLPRQARAGRPLAPRLTTVRPCTRCLKKKPKNYFN